MRRIIRYGDPREGAWKITAPDEVSKASIYRTIEWFSQAYQNHQLRPSPDQSANIDLSTIINLHNIEGVNNIQTMRELTDKIRRNQSIYNFDNGLPNVHLAKVGHQWVVINGHRTLMAYILCGRTKIAQLPHLIIENETTGDITEQELVAVFGEHVSEVDPDHWQAVVLDWSAPRDRQLVPRAQKNMGELTRALADRYGAGLNL